MTSQQIICSSKNIRETHSSQQRAPATTFPLRCLLSPFATGHRTAHHHLLLEPEVPGPYSYILPVIMVASSSNSSGASTASCRRNKPHLTVRLVLELMAADCCASQRRRTGPHPVVPPAAAAAVEADEESLRAALQRSLLEASRLHLNDSAGPDERLLQQQLLSSPASQFGSDSMYPAMPTTRRDRSSCCDEQSVGSAGSWEEEDQWEEDDRDYLGEDRDRLGAAARSRDLSLDDEQLSALADRGEDCCGGSSW